MATSEVARLLEIVAMDPSVQCPLATFVQDFMATKDQSLSFHEALAEKRLAYSREEEGAALQLEQCHIARDKLKAELQRIEAKTAALEKKKSELSTFKSFCSMALNGWVTTGTSPSDTTATISSNPTAAPQPTFPAKAPPAAAVAKPASDTAVVEGNMNDIKSLLAILQLPEAKESVLEHALNKFESQCVVMVETQWGPSEQRQAEQLMAVILQHLPTPRPPVQITEVRILTSLLRRAIATSAHQMIDVLANSRDNMKSLVKLISSVNDDVKCEAFECLSLIADSDATRMTFVQAGGIAPLVAVVASSASESVLERALILTWSLVSSDDGVRQLVREAGGVEAVLDLLYTDSLSILENVTMALGFMTREEGTKKLLRECGGLDKLTATLLHPEPAIQAKMAGAVWNCATDAENRVYLRQVGCIPAMAELLASPHEFVQESAAGAMWNLALDEQNKAQILDFGGIPPLVALLSSHNPSIVENASGAIWNCSSTVENRPALRKAGAIPSLLGLLQSTNEKIQENVAGSLRNCVINDQNKVAIREAGGIGVMVELLDRLYPVAQDKIASTLWISTVAPENKHAIRLCNAFPKLVRMLRDCPQSTTCDKILGIIRNCSMAAENRVPLIDCGALSAIVGFSGSRVWPSSTKENIAGAIWNLSRDDKERPRAEGALAVVCALLQEDSEAVVEQAAGAVSSLTVNNAENRETAVRHGAIEWLVRFLTTRHSTSNFTVLNVLLAVRNTSTQNEAAQIELTQRGVIPALLTLIERGTEDCAREAALCLRNVAAVRVGAQEIYERNGHTMLAQLAERAETETVKKAASMALQALSRRPPR